MILRRTPLAWRQLSHQKNRLLTAIAGVTFAAVLMFVQFGFQDALYESATLVHRTLHGDLILLHPRYESLVAARPFSRRHLYQAQNHVCIASVAPMYLTLLSWKNPWKGTERSLLVIGFEPNQHLLDTPVSADTFAQLNQPDTVLFDDLSRAEFGAVADNFHQGKRIFTELNRKRIEVKGLFSLGASFASDGTVITSETTFRRLQNRKPGDGIELGILKLTPGADAQKVKRDLSATLSPEVMVLTRNEFVELEKKYWEENSSIGFIFNLGVLMGFFVGLIIAYQILHSDVTNHLAEYATLKAMGYTDAYLIRVIFTESILLSIFGYGPAVLVAWQLFNVTATATSLPMRLSWERGCAVLILCVVMCFISGMIALRKLRQADPAEIF
jgi:putative ABC transport system permease protein